MIMNSEEHINEPAPETEKAQAAPGKKKLTGKKVLKTIGKCIRILIILVLAGILAVLGISSLVTGTTAKRILPSDSAELDHADAALVLGCAVYNGKPSPMLQDRLDTAIELYKDGKVSKLLMSGDHGKQYYDEVGTMKRYAIDAGVPSEDIFMDHAGFSTYESVYRAKEIFQCDSIIVVTQKYHLYRALYLCDRMDLKSQGVSASLRSYPGQNYYDFREVLARNEAFLFGITKPAPTYLGDPYPITGNGDDTND